MTNAQQSTCYIQHLDNHQLAILQRVAEDHLIYKKALTPLNTSDSITKQTGYGLTFMKRWMFEWDAVFLCIRSFDP
jgi:hypothetical protein